MNYDFCVNCVYCKKKLFGKYCYSEEKMEVNYVTGKMKPQRCSSIRLVDFCFSFKAKEKENENKN